MTFQQELEVARSHRILPVVLVGDIYPVVAASRPVSKTDSRLFAMLEQKSRRHSLLFSFFHANLIVVMQLI